MPRGDFAVVTHPDKQPACDFVTRSTTGPFVDTGVDVILRSRPGEPLRTERVYLAVSTIRQLAQLVGVGGDGVSNEARDAQLRAEGKLDALNEGIPDDIVRLARSLGRVLDLADRGADRLAGAESL